jgi:NAD-dependent dihydropyrimidine dehydrogenase PreA subunit
VRDDATFIGIEVDDAVAGDADLAQRLQEACPVDIYANEGGHVAVVHENVDECILCGLCIDASPPGAVTVHKLYSGEALGAER